MTKLPREILKFAAGLCVGLAGVWLSMRFSLDPASLDASPSDSGSIIGIMTMVISALSLLFQYVLEFFKNWTSWKFHDSQIDLGKLELQLNQDQLKLDYERLQLERDRFELDRERFERQRTEKSISGQGQGITYDLAGAIRPEVVMFGGEPAGYSEAPNLTKAQSCREERT